MKALTIVTVIVQMFFFLSCTTSTKNQEDLTKKQESSEAINSKTTIYYVKQSHDDAEEGINGIVDLTNEDLDLGQLSGFESEKAIAIRFEGIQLIKGQKIKQAFLQFSIEGNKSKAKQTELIIHAELSPNAEVFKDEPKNISSRKKTKSKVQWYPGPWDPKKSKRYEAANSELVFTC